MYGVTINDTWDWMGVSLDGQTFTLFENEPIYVDGGTFEPDGGEYLVLDRVTASKLFNVVDELDGDLGELCMLLMRSEDNTFRIYTNCWPDEDGYEEPEDDDDDWIF